MLLISVVIDEREKTRNQSVISCIEPKTHADIQKSLLVVVTLLLYLRQKKNQRESSSNFWTRWLLASTT